MNYLLILSVDLGWHRQS